MTTATLTYQKFSSSQGFSIFRLLGWVRSREKVLCFLFVAGIVLSLACYIGSLYVTFGVTTIVGSQEKELNRLSDEIREQEYQLQARTRRLPDEYKEFYCFESNANAVNATFPNYA
jgi:hypothetical protein